MRHDRFRNVDSTRRSAADPTARLDALSMTLK
jgi:hypothetical protein